MGSSPPLMAAPEAAKSSDAFVDSIGVNIHSTDYLGFSSTTYQNWNGVISAIATLGIRNVRDHVVDPTLLNELTAATGAKVDGILEQYYYPNGQTTLDPNSISTQIADAKQVNGLIAIEGPNEYNEVGDPNFVTDLTNYQAALYTAAKADPQLSGLPVIAPSLDNPALFSTFSGLAAYADKGNIHSYPPASTPTVGLSSWLADANQMTGSEPVWSTETGYHESTLPAQQPWDVSYAAAAKYIPRLLMENYNAGIEKSFLYELADDNVDPANSNSENNLGLVTADFTLKPAGVAVKNLISLLADPGHTFTPTSLDYTLTGGNSTVHHTLLEKSDGTFYLALWQDVSVFDKSTNTDLINPDLPVTITFNTPISDLTTYLPDGSTVPVADYGAVSQVNLGVPDQVLLLQITPVPEPASLSMIAGLAWGLLKRRRKQSEN